MVALRPPPDIFTAPVRARLNTDEVIGQIRDPPGRGAYRTSSSPSPSTGGAVHRGLIQGAARALRTMWGRAPHRTRAM